MAALLPGILTMVHQGRVHPLIVAPFQLARVCFLDLISLLEGISWEIPVGRDLLSLLQGTIYHPKLEIWKLWADQNLWSDSDLSTKVVETILSSTGSSTWKFHQEAVWHKTVTLYIMVRAAPPEPSQFLGWFSAGVPSRTLSTGLTPSTLKVYVAAILSSHISLDGASVDILWCLGSCEVLDGQGLKSYRVDLISACSQQLSCAETALRGRHCVRLHM